MKRGTTLSTITSLIALLLLAIAIVTPASASTILTIEREVCTTLVVEFPNETLDYPLCIVVVLQFVPGNRTSSIVIDVPIHINLGNQTITRVVKIPVEVSGEVKAIYIKTAEAPPEAEAEGGVIWVTPSPTPTPTPSPTPAPMHTALTPTTPAMPTPPPIQQREIVTVTRVVTETVPLQQASSEQLLGLLIGGLLAFASLFAPGTPGDLAAVQVSVEASARDAYIRGFNIVLFGDADLEPEKRPLNKIVFIAKVSRAGGKLHITIPKKLHPAVEHGKKYIVTLEAIEAEQK